MKAKPDVTMATIAAMFVLFTAMVNPMVSLLLAGALLVGFVIWRRRS